MSVRGADGTEVDSRENSPDGHDASPEKRTSKKRKVLSCYACRNRKMKCDRVYPVCGRCQKTGRADQCTYDPRLLEDSHMHVDGGAAPSFNLLDNNAYGSDQAHASPDDLRWKVRVQERRIQLLEQKLAAKDKVRVTSDYDPRIPEGPDLKEEMMFRGKGFKTQFHGATSVMTQIAQFRELQAFTREAFTVDHSITRVRTDFKTFRERRKLNSRYQEATTHGKEEEVFAALPEKSVVDVQVALYFQTWETSYRILHEPSFWKEYHSFWEHGPPDRSQVSFAVMLVLIVAVVKCLAPKDDVFLGDTTGDRQSASKLIEISDAWISRQPRKRLTLAFFQTQCLALFARRANCVKLKQDYVTSGDLFRNALAAGMHRDPSLLASGKISEFEKEMKRRLWVTIMELELQSSIESGLQSSLSGLHFDTPAPANLPDDAFSSASQEMPASRPPKHFTSASYLALSLKSLPLRIHLAQLLNDPSSDLQYSDILHFDAQVHAMLSSLPSWDDEHSTLPHALLQLQLRQYLLIMHKPFARLAAKNKRFMYSFTACVDAASSIIATHDELISKGSLALNHFRNDVVRVGLTLSQILYHNCTHHGPLTLSAPPLEAIESHFANQPSQSGEVPSAKSHAPPEMALMLAVWPQEPFLAKTLCITSTEILERSRLLFEQKVLRLGTAYMEFWLMSAAVGMLPSAPAPATSNAFATNASDDILSRCRLTLDRFTSLTFRILAFQKDPGNSFAVSLRDTMASVSPSDARTPSISGAVGVGAGASLGVDGMNSGQTPFATHSVHMGKASMEGPRDMAGPFDALQDMQVDLGGWSFPDFWAFDMGGDF